MGIRQNGDVLRHVDALFQAGAAGNLTDGQLLERYTDGERKAAELAFATLVERHGPMVLRVCRRVLGHFDEADDAFQATFLVLARRASSVRRSDSLGSWLHGVALRVAGCARKAEVRRRWYERRSAEQATNVEEHDHSALDLGPVLHEELARLPERFREPIVLCYLEGHSCEQAAARLNRPVGTVKSRLARGREALRSRLVRRGLAPSAAALAAAIAAEGVAGTVPATLLEITTRAAIALAAGKAAMAGTVPIAAAELMEGVLKTMAIVHRNRIAAGILALGIAATGAGALSRSASGDDPPRPPHESAKVTLPEYVVEPPDMIRVELRGAPEGSLRGERLVRPDGRVSLGEYGELYVAGLTTVEIKEKVVLHLRKFLSDRSLGLVKDTDTRPLGPDGRKIGALKNGKPALETVEPRDTDHVSVEVTTYNSKCYYVQGNVAAPGRFPVTGSETVLDAITYAGGVLPGTATAEVRLVRPGRTGADRRVLNVDLDAVVNRGDPTTNYQVLPGDRILVVPDPRSKPDRDDARPSSVRADDVKRLEDRLTAVERRLDRVIELLGGVSPREQPSKPSRPAPLER